MRYASAAGDNGVSSTPVRFALFKKFTNVVRLTFALDLKEQLAQTLAAIVSSILVGPRRSLDAEETAEPPLRQIIEVLRQVMCTHDAEKLAISVLEARERRDKTEAGAAI